MPLAMSRQQYVENLKQTINDWVASLSTRERGQNPELARWIEKLFKTLSYLNI